MVLFSWVYIQVTPYRDALIRGGSIAAAIAAFSGAVWVTMPILERDRAQ